MLDGDQGSDTECEGTWHLWVLAPGPACWAPSLCCTGWAGRSALSSSDNDYWSAVLRLFLFTKLKSSAGS